MSAREALRDAVNGKPPDPTADDLSDALGLTEHGLKVTGANVFGRGPNASVDLALSDGSTLRFERFSDIVKPALLATYLVTLTGVVSSFKGPQAAWIAAGIYKLAKHHDEADEDDATREFGTEYLRVAPTEDVDMGCQADRWRAFSTQARLSPARDAGEDRSAEALAAASVVLVDPATGKRYVRTGWFQSYVKREVGGLYSPAALAQQMLRVGWTRPNSEGRIKATSPTDGRSLGWSFYVVEADWDAQVPAGSSSNARTHTYARDRSEPAGTRNLAEVDAAPLDDAIPAPGCTCEQPLPAPDDDELRCARCGHACAGWGGAS